MFSTTSSTLLRDLRRPDAPQAWQIFVDRYRPMVFGFARRRGLQEADAENVAQEVLLAFVKAHRAGQYDREKGHFRNWLGQIAARTTASALRARARRERQPPDTSATGLLEQIADPSEGGLQQTWETEWRQYIWHRCRQTVAVEFEPRTLEVFDSYIESYLQDELSADHVAAKLGVSRDVVYSAKSRVLKRMREVEAELELAE